jgi:hypothetical protein
LSELAGLIADDSDSNKEVLDNVELHEFESCCILGLSEDCTICDEGVIFSDEEAGI